MTRDLLTNPFEQKTAIIDLRGLSACIVQAIVSLSTSDGHRITASLLVSRLGDATESAISLKARLSLCKKLLRSVQLITVDIVCYSLETCHSLSG